MTTELTQKEALPFDELQVGDLVEHPKWGIGSILHRSGRGENTKLVVTFPELEGSGQKKLKAKFAGLKRIEDTKPQEEEETKDKEKESAKVEEAKAEDEESEDGEEDEEDEEDVFDEKEAARALNIEDEEEEVAKADVSDDDWEEEESN